MVATAATDARAVTNAPALTVCDAVAGYGRRVVLRGVTVQVQMGEVVGVIGPNGCGKTTLLRVATGVLRPRLGAVFLGERDPTRLRPDAIARFAAVVPQSATLPEGFTGLETVLLGRTPHLRLLQSEGPRDIAIAHQALALSDAEHLASRRVEEMSGGERQRLLIARALAQEPRLLLLDEPTAHLDIVHQASVFDLVARRCRAGGLGALVVVHDLTLAAQFCDRLYLIADGVVLAHGPADEVLRQEELSAAYGGPVTVIRHPETGRPVVIPSGAAYPAPREANDG